MSEQPATPDVPTPRPASPEQREHVRPPVVPPYAGPPQPGYYPYPYQPQPPYNVMAILSLALGLLVFPPLGIIFGYMAKRQIEQSGERGVELATAGIIVGWVITGLYVLMCLFMITIMASPAMMMSWT